MKSRIWMLMNGTNWKMSHHFPYFIVGQVVHGFGRGGKELGCPTGK
jgi:FAD synthase